MRVRQRRVVVGDLVSGEVKSAPDAEGGQASYSILLRAIWFIVGDLVMVVEVSIRFLGCDNFSLSCTSRILGINSRRMNLGVCVSRPATVSSHFIGADCSFQSWVWLHY